MAHIDDINNSLSSLSKSAATASQALTDAQAKLDEVGSLDPRVIAVYDLITTARVHMVTIAGMPAAPPEPAKTLELEASDHE